MTNLPVVYNNPKNIRSIHTLCIFPTFFRFFSIPRNSEFCVIHGGGVVHEEGGILGKILGKSSKDAHINRTEILNWISFTEELIRVVHLQESPSFRFRKSGNLLQNSAANGEFDWAFSSGSPQEMSSSGKVGLKIEMRNPTQIADFAVHRHVTRAIGRNSIGFVLYILLDCQHWQRRVKQQWLAETPVCPPTSPTFRLLAVGPRRKLLPT